ncbi:MAG: uroporphyrinogen decarboxylase family protein [Candidatus Hodarchaeota archaeon]
MNSKERVLTAFQHKEPDRVPLFEAWIESEIEAKLGGNPYIARERLGLDCLPLGAHPANTKVYGHGIDEWGRIFKKGQYGGGVVKNWEDLEKFTPPTSHAQDWFPNSIYKIKQKYGEKYALFFAWHDCSLGLAYMLLGMENFFSVLYDDPDFVKALIIRGTTWVIALVEQANAAGVDFIILGDDAADNSRPMISPQMFRNLILPEYKKIIQTANVPVIWHSDGNVEPLLPIIIEAGFSGVHSLETKANINLSHIKEKYGEKLVLAGNIDTTGVLCQSNLSIVRNDVERAIRQGASGGGFFLSSSNSLFEGHNIKAIREVFRYAKEIGKYPIRI